MLLALFAISPSGLPFNPEPETRVPFTQGGFGEIVDTFHFSSLAEFSLSGITYCEALGRFYLVDVMGREVYSFDPADPEGTLSDENFDLRDVFNDGYLDWQWGIAWADTVFFVSSAPAVVDSAALSRYSGSGSYLGTVRLDSIADGWFAGLDYCALDSTLWCVNVLGPDSAYEVDPAAPDSALDQASQWVASQRGVSFLGLYHDTAPLDTVLWLLVGGWNDDHLYLLDAHGASHTLLDIATIPGFTDLDIWEDTTATDSIYAFATINDQDNTLYKVSLGLSWADWMDTTGLAEDRGKVASFSLRPNPSPGAVFLSGLSGGTHLLSVHDVSGRLALGAEFTGTGTSFKLEAKGVYFVRVDQSTARLVIR